jgi:hypothetical protein
MLELPMETIQRLEEAGKDREWSERVRCAENWEALEVLLAEKGVEASAELKAAFEAGGKDKTGKLEDDDLEKVSGGYLLPCPQEYDIAFCELSHCPHMYKKPIQFNWSWKTTAHCDLGYY